MKKKTTKKDVIRAIALTLVMLLVAGMCVLLGGCATKEEQLSADVTKLETEVLKLQSEIAVLEADKHALEESITDVKVENGTAKYVLTINIKQTHFTLDIGQHLKDSMNDISIQIPVDKENFDSVNVGDVIDDSFRMGSLFFKGSFGSWDITVEDKQIL